ncbi:MAG: hypothetical protein KBD78_16820 [Oligoflexales bacterium]|nr:hypothetical protein [Oligoflexales bacterium]
MLKRLFPIFILNFALIANSPQASAQATDERFQDLFVTAGYSTAFGAALGAAFLAFTDEPASQLRYVAMGASLGFIGGSILGTYIIFSPMFVAEKIDEQEQWASNAARPNLSANSRPTLSSVAARNTFSIGPIYEYSSGKVTGLSGGINLAIF